MPGRSRLDEERVRPPLTVPCDDPGAKLGKFNAGPKEVEEVPTAVAIAPRHANGEVGAAMGDCGGVDALHNLVEKASLRPLMILVEPAEPNLTTVGDDRVLLIL